jgi:hypothetical protein
MHKIAPHLSLATTTGAHAGYHHLIASTALAAAGSQIPGLGALLLLVLAILFIGAVSSAASAARGLAMVLSELFRVVRAVIAVMFTGVIVLVIAVAYLLHH